MLYWLQKYISTSDNLSIFLSRYHDIAFRTNIMYRKITISYCKLVVYKYKYIRYVFILIKNVCTL